MRYLGERRGVRLMALKALALCVHDCDLAWSFSKDFSMWCALACKDENEVRVKICRELQNKRNGK